MKKNNTKEENKRLLIATFISTILIVAWTHFYNLKIEKRTINQIKPKDNKVIISKEIEENVGNKEKENNKDIKKVSIETNIAKNNNLDIKTDADKILDKRIPIKTKLLSGSFNLRGLVFDDLVLNDYDNEVDSLEKVKLLNNFNDKDAYFVNIGWESGDEIPNKNTIWTANADVLESNIPLTLTYKNKKGILFQVTITVDDGYMFKIEQKVKNGSKDVTILKTKNSISKKQYKEPEMSVHNGFIGVVNGRIEEIEYKKFKKKDFYFNNNNSWGGWTSKYWLMAIITDSSFSVDLKDDLYNINYIGENISIEPNTEYTISSHIFMGAKVLQLLDNYSKEYKIPLFDRAVDFGWYYFLTKPLYLVLKLFYNFMGNFGISILFLTLIIRGLMFPISNKSFTSVARIKQIQPKVDDIKKRYKDDKIMQNKATIELYKRENVSPLSGCLPMVIQIPIFFSLYKVLVISIDMRHAKFFGYLKDLAGQDNTTIFNLFGLLPFDVNFLRIGLLPCLMAFTMWLQQKISDSSKGRNDEVATATKIMPIFFLFMFNNMPTGLLIYWTFSNVLSILQQLIIEKRILNKNKIKVITK
jgi:YidC/Oxa1 family membrane protein insertase